MFVIRKYSRKAPAVAVVLAERRVSRCDPLLARYHDQIEKEVDKLD